MTGHPLLGKTAFVSGSGKNIGRAIALQLAALGCNVVVNGARDQAGCEKTAAGVTAAGAQALVAMGDVAKPDDVARMIDAAQARFGGIDILVNNAGITRDSTIMKMSRANWDAVIDTNLGSCFNMVHAVWESMQERSFGRIINIGSINGQGGQYGQVNYAAAKSGIHGFTKALAQEGARYGITVNALAPGYVDTDMVAAVPERVLEKIIQGIPMRRLGTAHDIARGVVFLCGNDADFITGSTLSINGGQHMY